MLSLDVLYAKAVLKLADVYGMEYMKLKVKHTPVARWDDGTCIVFYFMFEDEDERPDLQANYKGWTVYAGVSVDKNTGEATMLDYVLPDGTRMEK